jgi:hypothetical protein
MKMVFKHNYHFLGQNLSLTCFLSLEHQTKLIFNSTGRKWFADLEMRMKNCHIIKDNICSPFDMLLIYVAFVQARQFCVRR